MGMMGVGSGQKKRRGAWRGCFCKIQLMDWLLMASMGERKVALRRTSSLRKNRERERERRKDRDSPNLSFLQTRSEGIARGITKSDEKQRLREEHRSIP